jgi:hypothetical protein
MSLTKEGYKYRLLDDRITRYLRVFGAVSIGLRDLQRTVGFEVIDHI